LDTRRDNRNRGFSGWAHAAQASWEEKIVDEKQCHFDDGSGSYAINEESLPKHIEPVPRRMFKLLMHTSGIWP
jgi:hypothetical protein